MIDGFELEARTTVRDFIATNDLIRTELRTVLQGARIIQVEPGVGTVRVTVEIPGPEIWSTLADEMRVQSYESAQPPSTQPAQ